MSKLIVSVTALLFILHGASSMLLPTLELSKVLDVFEQTYNQISLNINSKDSYDEKRLAQLITGAKNVIEHYLDTTCQESLNNVLALEKEALDNNRQCHEYYQQEREGNLLLLRQKLQEGRVYLNTARTEVLACDNKASCLYGLESKYKEQLKSDLENIKYLENNRVNIATSINKCQIRNEEIVKQKVEEIVVGFEECVHNNLNDGIQTIFTNFETFLDKVALNINTPNKNVDELHTQQQIINILNVAKNVMKYSIENGCGGSMAPFEPVEEITIRNHKKCNSYHNNQRDEELRQIREEIYQGRIYLHSHREQMNQCYNNAACKNELQIKIKEEINAKIFSLTDMLSIFTKHTSSLIGCHNHNEQLLKEKIDEVVGPFKHCIPKNNDEQIQSLLTNFEEFLNKIVHDINIPNKNQDHLFNEKNLREIISVGKGVIEHSIQNGCGGSMAPFEGIEDTAIFGYKKCVSNYESQREHNLNEIRRKVYEGRIYLNSVRNNVNQCANNAGCINDVHITISKQIVNEQRMLSAIMMAYSRLYTNLEVCQNENEKIVKEKIEEVARPYINCFPDNSEKINHKLNYFEGFLDQIMHEISKPNKNLNELESEQSIQDIVSAAKNVLEYSIQHGCGGSMVILEQVEQEATTAHKKCISFYDNLHEEILAKIHNEIHQSRIFLNSIRNDINQCANNAGCINQLESQVNQEISINLSGISSLMTKFASRVSNIEGCQRTNEKLLKEKVEIILGPYKDCVPKNPSEDLTNFELFLNQISHDINQPKNLDSLYSNQKIRDMVSVAKSVRELSIKHEIECSASLEKIVGVEEKALNGHQNCITYFDQQKEQTLSQIRDEIYQARIYLNSLQNDIKKPSSQISEKILLAKQSLTKLNNQYLKHESNIQGCRNHNESILKDELKIVIGQYQHCMGRKA